MKIRVALGCMLVMLLPHAATAQEKRGEWHHYYFTLHGDMSRCVLSDMEHHGRIYCPEHTSHGISGGNAPVTDVPLNNNGKGGDNISLIIAALPRTSFDFKFPIIGKLKEVRPHSWLRFFFDIDGDVSACMFNGSDLYWSVLCPYDSVQGVEIRYQPFRDLAYLYNLTHQGE